MELGLPIYRGHTLPNKVMVVEDEQILAQNLQAYLEVKRMEVRLAHDGSSAIELAKQFVPDLVVLDFRLPDMEGFQVFDTIRQSSDCIFVLITGHPTSQVYDGAKQRGIQHILFKPFPLAELARTLTELLEERQPGNGFVERRRTQAASFPLRMYDGTWVTVDRRKPRSDAANDDATDNDATSVKTDPPCE